MNISEIKMPQFPIQNWPISDEPKTSESFGKLLEKTISDVNERLAESDKMNLNLATGKSENLHEAMIAVEKAETALKLLVQVRNKALDAYQEIMRMQV